MSARDDAAPLPPLTDAQAAKIGALLGSLEREASQ